MTKTTMFDDEANGNKTVEYIYIERVDKAIVRESEEYETCKCF